MTRTFSSFLFNPPCSETQQSQPNLHTQAPLALLCDFLTQRQGEILEILESRESHIHVKSMIAAQQMIISRITALEAFQRDISSCQFASVDDVVSLTLSQTSIEGKYSAIEAMLSNFQNDLLSLQTSQESLNRMECDLFELSTEVRSVLSTSAISQETLSGQMNDVEERLCHQAGEVTELRICAESVQKDLGLALGRL
jgi:hypothetical protein